jgi:pimeloyl-ACP methyl ester carboxylesterase
LLNAAATMRASISLAAVLLGGCFHSIPGPTGDDDGGSSEDAIEYRDDMNGHPGCTTDGLTYPAAALPGFACAAKAYGGTSATKSVVLLVHGNSDSPLEWEQFEDGAPMLAERLVAAGHPTYAVDYRIDRCDDPQANNDTENAARNVDHGWAVPIVQRFILAAIEKYPDRKLTLVGFSLGVTVIRDALRRIHLAGDVPDLWSHLDHVVLLAGANHGVSSFARLCGKNPTMRGEVACEMGNRDAYAPTDFLSALNGPDGAWETPCADGATAFGEDACNGATVKYTTVVMRDIANGSYQDEFVSEASSALAGADNRLLELTDVDESGYFFGGLLKNHYGSARSAAALAIALEVLP